MGSLGLGFGAAHLHFEGMPLPRPVLSSSPTVTGSGVETTPLLSDETDTWSYDASPATVTAHAYRLVLDGSVAVGPQSAAKIAIPDGTSGQSYSYELQVRIAEGGGLQSAWTRLATGTVPDALDLSRTAEGEVEIVNATGTVTVAITSPSWYANYDAGNAPGIFAFDSADLASGPVNLVPPLIERTTDADSSGTTNEGDTVGIGDPASDTSYPGLWVYDPDVGGLGMVSYQWQADAGGDGSFANLSGAKSTIYTLTSGEGGDDVRVQETLADSGGSRTAVSVEAATSTATTDDFNRADGALEASSNWSTIWVHGGGSGDVVSNQFYMKGDGSSGLYVATHQGTFANDQYCEFEWISADNGNDEAGVIVRAVQSAGGKMDGYVVFYQDNGNLKMQCRSDGFTDWQETAFVTLTSGGVLRLEANGATIRCLVNGVEQLSRTDSTHASGQPGVWSYVGRSGRGTTVDNWEAGDL